MSLVTITLVTWNSSRVLRSCLESLRAQTFTDWRLIVVDNASIDDSRAVVKQLMPDASLIQSPRNNGFGRAHNQAIQLSSSPYILCLNPDTVLEPTALEVLVHAMESAPGAAAIGPKLLRYTLSDDEIDPVVRTTTIDSTGITQGITGLCRERGANHSDTGQLNTPEEVFAVSAAACLLRRSALNDIQYNGEYFDASFFAYKEDVDLCWRLRRAGWQVRYEPSATVYHRRTFQEPAEFNQPRAVAKSRHRRDGHIRRLSYRNHLLMLAKNLGRRDWKRLPLIFGTEIAKLGFLLVTEPRTVRGLGGALRALPEILRKRKLSQKS